MNSDANPSEIIWDRIAAWRRAWLAKPWFVVLCFSLLLSLTWLGAQLPLRKDISFPEGALAVQALEAAQGRSPYTDWRTWPHQFAPYGPLSYYFPGWLLRLEP